MCALENIASFIGNYFVFYEGKYRRGCCVGSIPFCLNMVEGNKYDGL